MEINLQILRIYMDKPTFYEKIGYKYDFDPWSEEYPKYNEKYPRKLIQEYRNLPIKIIKMSDIKYDPNQGINIYNNINNVKLQIENILNKYLPLSDSETLSDYMYKLWELDCEEYALLDENIDTISLYT